MVISSSAFPHFRLLSVVVHSRHPVGQVGFDSQSRLSTDFVSESEVALFAGPAEPGPRLQLSVTKPHPVVFKLSALLA